MASAKRTSKDRPAPSQGSAEKTAASLGLERLRQEPQPAERAVGIEQQLCFALYSASRAFTRAYAPLLEPLGLTYLQYVVMLVLWERDDLAVNELGERLSLDSGTLTPLLKRLESAGLIRRERWRQDERVVRIVLTPAGKKLEPQARAVPKELMRRAGYLSAQDGLEKLGRLKVELQDLTDRLERSLTVEPPQSEQ